MISSPQVQVLLLELAPAWHDACGSTLVGWNAMNKHTDLFWSEPPLAALGNISKVTLLKRGCWGLSSASVYRIFLCILNRVLLTGLLFLGECFHYLYFTIY